MRTLGFLFLILQPTTFAAPALKGKPAHYFATDVGTVLEYETRSGEKDNPRFTLTITASDVKEGKTIVTTQRRGDGSDSQAKFEVSEKGVVALDKDGQAIAKPYSLLKLPLRKADTWEAGIEEQAKNKYTFQSVGEEDIEVPAGKFKALRVDATITVDLGGASLEVKQSTWYALHLGPIKMTVTANQAGLNREQVLKSIKLPKK